MHPRGVRHMADPGRLIASTVAVYGAEHARKVYGEILPVGGIGSKVLAEDLTSETFFRALRSMSSFRWQGKDFGAWLMTIARNLTTDHFKTGRSRLELATDDELVDAVLRFADMRRQRSRLSGGAAMPIHLLRSRADTRGEALESHA